MSREMLLQCSHLTKRYGKVTALEAVSLALSPGEGLLAVGETGSGKTTLAKVICGGVTPDEGQVLLQGRPLAPSCRRRAFGELAAIQYIFQDPYSAVDLRQTVAQVLEEAVRICRRHRHPATPAQRALEDVDPALLQAWDRPAGTLSGGQLQKVCVARALIPNPKVLIADEATSMLDQAGAEELFRLLGRIRRERGVALLAIVHDIDFSQPFWDRIAVFQGGHLVEELPFEQFSIQAKHPYSRKLLESYRYFYPQEGETHV